MTKRKIFSHAATEVRKKSNTFFFMLDESLYVSESGGLTDIRTNSVRLSGRKKCRIGNSFWKANVNDTDS